MADVIAHPSVRAVPMTYRGARFRSTLEADWAATLDALRIVWEYEPEALRLPSGEYYRPDFYLPKTRTWLEVKGPHDERIEKTRELADVVEHDPECDRVPRPARLLVIAHSDDEEAAIGRALAAAPDGVTAVRVVRLGDRVLRRHHVRRKITVTPDLIALMRVFRPILLRLQLDQSLAAGGRRPPPAGRAHRVGAGGAGLCGSAARRPLRCVWRVHVLRQRAVTLRVVPLVRSCG